MKFFIVREDILPESILRAVRAKEMLLKGEVSTVNEAVEKVSLSRSAYYKYKDRVFTFHSHVESKDITIYMILEHRSGVLSNVLTLIAALKGNIITIRQELPVQGLASVCINLDISNLSGDIDTILDEVRKIDGVKTVSLHDMKNAV